MDNDLLKLKTSLCDVINKWMNEQAESDEEWNALNTHVSDNVAELMTDSAFSVLLAQSDLSKYLRENDHLKY